MSQSVAVRTSQPAAPVARSYSVTSDELALLSQLADPDNDDDRGSRIGVSAISALLVHEMLGHVQRVAEQIATIASAVVSPQNPAAPHQAAPIATAALAPSHPAPQSAPTTPAATAVAHDASLFAATRPVPVTAPITTPAICGPALATCVTLDPCSIEALGAAFASAGHGFSKRLDELEACVKRNEAELEKQRVSNEALCRRVDILERTNAEIAALRTALTEKARLLECQVNDLREEVTRLVAEECGRLRREFDARAVFSQEPGTRAARDDLPSLGQTLPSEGSARDPKPKK